MRYRRQYLREWSFEARRRWHGLPPGGRLNVVLYVLTGLSMFALVIELASGVAGGGSADVASVSQPGVAESSGPTTTLRDRRPDTTVIPVPTTAATTTVAPPTTLAQPGTTRAPAPRRPPTPPPPTVAPTTVPPPITEAPPTTKTKVTIDPNNPPGLVPPEPPDLSPFPPPVRSGA